MNKYKLEIENNSIKITRGLKKFWKNSTEILEKKMRNEYHYQMKLALNELFEEFMDEKLNCELFWRKELKTVNENNNRAIKYLKVSLKAEHIQNLTELKNWYEIQNQNIFLKIIDNLNGTIKHK